MAKFDLKSIYTSDKEYTVLQLLKELVDTIDNTHVTILYKHTCIISGQTVTIVSSSPSKIPNGAELCNAIQQDTFIKGTYTSELSPILGSRITTYNITYYDLVSMSVKLYGVDPVAICEDTITEI